jgi:hypothetical protein
MYLSLPRAASFRYHELGHGPHVCTGLRCCFTAILGWTCQRMRNHGRPPAIWDERRQQERAVDQPPGRSVTATIVA